MSELQRIGVNHYIQRIVAATCGTVFNGGVRLAASKVVLDLRWLYRRNHGVFLTLWGCADGSDENIKLVR